MRSDLPSGAHGEIFISSRSREIRFGQAIQSVAWQPGSSVLAARAVLVALPSGAPTQLLGNLPIFVDRPATLDVGSSVAETPRREVPAATCRLWPHRISTRRLPVDRPFKSDWKQGKQQGKGGQNFYRATDRQERGPHRHRARVRAAMPRADAKGALRPTVELVDTICLLGLTNLCRCVTRLAAAETS